MQQGREGEAWYIARGRYEHLMVARTRISDGYLARARAVVALARSWRPQEVLPGARTWAEAQAGGLEALRGLQTHLAIQPPPDDGDSGQGTGPPSTASGPLPGGHRLRLAVVAAAGDGDQVATVALIREGARQGLDADQLVAVAERHWPKPPLHRRAFRAGRRWTAAWLLRLHRPCRRAAVLLERESRP